MEGIVSIHDTIRSVRVHLVKALECNEDYNVYLNSLIRIRCPIQYRYELLDIHGLITKNNQNVEVLKKIGSALSILEKYGRHLLKPVEARSDMWRYIKFTNKIFSERIDAIQGGRDVMKQMGYTQPIEDGLAYPEGGSTDSSHILTLVADIVLARKELDVFFIGRHPVPEVIEDLLPPNTKAHARQVQSIMKYSMESGIQPAADLQKIPLTVQTSSVLRQLKEHAQQLQTPLSSSYSTERSQGQSQSSQGQSISTEHGVDQRVPTTGGISQNQPVYRDPPQGFGNQFHVPPAGSSQMIGQHYVVPVSAGQQGQPLLTGSQHGQPPQQIVTPIILQPNVQQYIPSLSHIPPPSPKLPDDIGSSVDPPKYQKEVVTEKTSSSSAEAETSDIVCDICGDNTAKLACQVCDNKQLCPSCDQKWHRHPKRKNHERKDIQFETEQKSEEDVYVTANFNQPRPTAAGSQNDNTAVASQPQIPSVVENVNSRQPSQVGVATPGPRDSLSSPAMVYDPASNCLLPVLAVSQRPGVHGGQVQHQSVLQQQAPSYSMPPPQQQPCQSLPQSNTNTAPGGPTSSRLLPNIMAIPDLQKRKSKLEISIVSLQEEVDDTEEKITSIVERNPEFYQDDQYNTLSRKKGMLQRESMKLRKYLNELENMEEPQKGLQKQENVDISKQQIFFPPNTPVLSHSQGTQYPHGPYSLVQTSEGLVMTPTSYIYQGPVQHYYAATSPPAQGQIIQGHVFPPPEAQRPSLPITAQSPHHQQGNIMRHGGQSLPIPEHLRKDQALTNKEDLQIKHGSSPQTSEKFQPSYPPVNKNYPAFGLDPLDNIAQSENYLNDSKIKRNKYDVTKQQIYYPPSEVKETQAKTDALKLKSAPKERESVAIAKPNQGKETPPQQSKSDVTWTCDHCTFINTGKTKVCQICSKTTTYPKYVTVDLQSSDSGGIRKNDPADDEETEVLLHAANAGKRIEQVHDEIYYEKMEAQKKEKERLQKLELEQQERMRQDTKKPKEVIEIQEKYPIPVSEDPNASPPAKPDIKKVLRMSPVKQTGSPSPPLSLGSGDNSGNFGSSNFNFNQRMEAIKLKKQQEQMAYDGKEMIRLIKTAETEGFSVEELQIAVNICADNMSPLKWLKEKWPDMLETVVCMATNKGRELESNCVGDLTVHEAKDALLEKQGNLTEAVQMCVDRRKSGYQEITPQGDFAREAILQALHSSKGNTTKALEELYTSSIQHFLDRIWQDDQEEITAAQPIEGANMREFTFQESCNSVNNSILGHHNFNAFIRNTEMDLNRRIRMIMVEGKLQSWGRAETVIKILDTDVAKQNLEATLEEIVEAVRNCGDRQSSLVYLQQDCQCCLTPYPMSKICNLGCQCKICYSCVRTFFEVNIREKHVRNLSCPLCGFPDMEDTDSAADYLTFIALLLQNLVSVDIQELYQTKLRDWNLQKDPNFRWCAHCGNGFIWDRGEADPCMRCTICRKMTCFLCKKQWEDQHANLTCEEFEQWKIDNDPENQAIGLARHLEINGIDCPSCKMRYALAKGGCMHFKCPECGHEFCSGCSQKFVTEGPCVGYKKCMGRGLHCHHPRDCFYYLRDNNIEDLQRVLRDKKLNFDTDVAPDQDDPLHCPLMEQKEKAEGKNDEACGKDVLKGHAGLCVNHYKEYLVGIINKNKADPVNILSLNEMKILLEREEKNVPQLKPNERESQYRKRVIQYIKEKIPLKRNR